MKLSNKSLNDVTVAGYKEAPVSILVDRAVKRIFFEEKILTRTRCVQDQHVYLSKHLSY